MVAFDPANLLYISGFMPDGAPELILNKLSTNHIKIAVAQAMLDRDCPAVPA